MEVRKETVEIGGREPEGRTKGEGSGSMKVSREMSVETGRELIVDVGRAVRGETVERGECGGESRGEW